MRINLVLALPVVLALTGTAVAQSMSSSPAPMASGSAMSGGAMLGSSSKATVSLSAQNDSKETGTATLTETKKGLVVTVTTDTAPDSPQPDHIHKGTCAKLDPVPAYPLKPIEKSGDSKGMSTTTLTGVTLADLEKGEYAINVHKSADDLKDYVACGDIKAP